MNVKHGQECVLLIEAHADETAGIAGELISAMDDRFQVERVTALSGGIERLRGGGVGAIVLGLAPADGDGFEAFDRLFEVAAGVPILIWSVTGTEEVAKRMVQRGAYDYLVKGQADSDRLRRTVRTMMDRHAAESVCRENEAANFMLDSIGEAVLRTDIRGNVAYLNRMAENLTGWCLREALGHPVADVLRLTDNISGAQIDNTVAAIIREDKTGRTMANCIDCTLVRRDGVGVKIENRATLMQDQRGVESGVVMAFRDVSEARASSLQMSHLAQHDVLTNLPNRALFNDRLAQAISLAERQGKRLAVLFVDLDRFKRINDSLGHGVGDKLLQSVAGRLLGCVRRADTVSRLGGDEFVVLLSQLEHAEDAAFSAQKILRAVGAPHTIDNKSLDVNVSIGGSTYPDDGRDAESLMTRADEAMYAAKQSGRNGYRFFRRDMHAQLAKRLSLEGDLRYALGRNEFVLHYQPKVDLQSGRITGMEALIRWLHPQRGMLFPVEFISVAEECGLIRSIGRWVLLEACRQARAWSDAEFGVVPVSVNVSAAEFGAKDFLSGVRAVLIATGVEPLNLELELTESVLMEDAESAVTTLLALKAMGVKLAIDDFGTGYSSFTYLRRFPVDALKLDRSFVRDIAEDSIDANIVGAMINLGRSLQRQVVAEGVETRAQLTFLKHHGCGEGQGHYFARSVTAEQAGNLLKAGLQEKMVA